MMETGCMSLNQQQKDLIISVDKKANILLATGANEATLLAEMLDLMPGIKDILDSAPKKEVEIYLCEYDGFYRYMKVLESLAQAIANGRITVPD